MINLEFRNQWGLRQHFYVELVDISLFYYNGVFNIGTALFGLGFWFTIDFKGNYNG